jgi:glycosyltransferase involved in cell wall biosynthesis
MAAYNAAAFLGPAIDSITSQTFTDWMLIVVDDGSTDETFELLSASALRDGRIKPLRQVMNRGLAHSLNFGIAQTHSELIARMDADDRCLPNRLRAQLEFMTARPEVDVLGSAMELVAPQGAPVRMLTRPERHEDLAGQIFFCNPFFHPTVMYRRAFIQRYGGYAEELRRAQDYDLWLRAYRDSVYHNLQEPLVQYRMPPRITLRNAGYSARVILRSLRREKRWASGIWYAFRPVIAYGAYRVGYKRK